MPNLTKQNGSPDPHLVDPGLQLHGDLDSGWFWFDGDEVEDLPLCATCGTPAIGTFSADGSPRYPMTCDHPPIYPTKRDDPLPDWWTRSEETR